jgi:iron-sulfur cluster assembly accessory protein
MTTHAATGTTPETLQVTVTPAAMARVKALITEQEIPAEEHNLRIFVQPGGCSGFSYGLAFDKVNPEDKVQAYEGFQVVVDSKSLQYLQGMVVDFVDSVQEQGFKISNPNAKSSCGCGQSFQA